MLFSFSESLTTKCVPLNNEPCIASCYSYYPLMISLDECNGNCNAIDDSCKKICVPSETKEVNVKVFNMITRINEAKSLVKHISYDCICKFDSTTCNFDNILLVEKPYENIFLIYNVSYESLTGAKPLDIIFDKVHGFIRDCDGTKFLVLFVPEKYNAIYDRIRYPTGLKSDITYVFLIIIQNSKLIQMMIYL